jgi:hypothetical protein
VSETQAIDVGWKEKRLCRLCKKIKQAKTHGAMIDMLVKDTIRRLPIALPWHSDLMAINLS